MGKRVLVIDDEEAVRKSFVLALEDSDYQIDTVGSGEEGIEKARTTKYAVIFLDLKMPGLDGVATLRELYQIDREVPIYIITAFHTEFFDKLKGAAKDGIDFQVLEKPIDIDQILSFTKAVLEGAVEYHERSEQNA